MKGKKIAAARQRMEDALRSSLGRVTPDGRVVIILALLFLFSAGSVYMTVSSIYNMGKKSGSRQMRMEHIEPFETAYKQQGDSINPINRFDYE